MKLCNYTIILLSGKAGSGKDTVANYLVNNYSYTKFAFADELKDYVAYKYNLNKELLYTQKGKKTRLIDKNLTVRELLIKEGMEQRKINPNFWTDIIIQKLLKLDKKQYHRIVISDFRFPNEFYELYNIFQDVISVNIHRKKGCDIIDDISEESLNNFHFDHYILNNANIEVLFKTIDEDKNIKNYIK